jgi:plastocyanin
MAGVVVAAVVGFAVYGHGPGSAKGGAEPSLMSATCNSIANGTVPSVQHVAYGGSGNHTYFLVVAADPPSPFAGFNGSYYAGNLSEEWPIMHVRLGDTVSIHVVNCQSHEPHGFAITFYDDNSIVAIQPGHSYDVTFTATKAGTFRVYCSIFCAIHAFMQNGALVVS